MPQKTEENTRNKILNIAFNRAKDAARVIRRLEYSYGMRTNIILAKQIGEFIWAYTEKQKELNLKSK